jgi:hypothetical protein
MSLVKIRLSPSEKEHTEVTITMMLEHTWSAWELQYFCDILTANSGKPVRVVLPADAPSGWLKPWCESLANAASHRIETQFLYDRRERRWPRPDSGQMEAAFMKGLL